MQISEKREDTLIVLSLNGRLDHAGAGVFQEKALAAIQGGARQIIVDFGGTDFIASMGIRALIVPTQEVARHGGRLVLTGLNDELLRFFEISGMKDMFAVYDSVGAAQIALTA